MLLQPSKGNNSYSSTIGGASCYTITKLLYYEQTNPKLNL